MKEEVLLKAARDWSGGNIAERLDMCRSMLFAHGLTTMSENDRIFAKLNKRYASAIETRSAETHSGSVRQDESAAAKPDAQPQSPITRENSHGE